jgi:hypothetical protein
MMRKISKAAAHYRVPIQEAVEFDLHSNAKAVDVTFMPGQIGFDVEEDIVIGVSDEGQARREGVKVGWKIKAVNGQACDSFFDDPFESAKVGKKPYRVTFLKEIEDARHEALVPYKAGDTALANIEENSYAWAEKLDRPRKDDFMKLWYCRDEPQLTGNASPVVLIAGFFTKLRAQVNIPPGGETEWTKYVKFHVEPQLPEGLCLNEATGAVTGVPLNVQETASTHYITANIHAFAPGGIPIGMVTLASCNFVIRILDANKYNVCWTEETTDGLVLKLTSEDSTL